MVGVVDRPFSGISVSVVSSAGVVEGLLSVELVPLAKSTTGSGVCVVVEACSTGGAAGGGGARSEGSGTLDMLGDYS